MEKTSVNKWLVVGTVMLPTMMEIIDTTVVNVSLPHIQGSLSVGVEEITWVLTSYLISNAIIIPMTAWLASIFGRKRYMLFSISLFTFSSLMCGTASSLSFLVFFRFLQGLAGGGLQPTSQAILLESFPLKERGMAISIYMMGTVMGPTIGPILGGWITDHWGWRWIFYINLPIGVISLFMVTFFIFDPAYIKRKIKKIDYWGLCFLSIGLASLQTVLDKGHLKDWFSSRFIVVLSVISFSLLVLFVINEIRTKQPLVQLRIFKKRSYAIGCTIIFLGFFAFFGSVVLLPLYVQKLMGYTAFLAGLVMGPGAIASIFFLPLVGRLTKFIDARYLLAIGFMGQLLALYLMSHFTLQIGFWQIIWPRLIQGAGLAFFFVPLATVAFMEVKKQEMGNATAIYNLLRNLGASFGTAIVTTILSRRAQFHQNRLIEHLSPTDIPFQQSYEQLRHYFPSDFHALGGIYRELLHQTNMLAFNDAFFFCFFLFLILLPSLIILKKAKKTF